MKRLLYVGWVLVALLAMSVSPVQAGTAERVCDRSWYAETDLAANGGRYFQWTGTVPTGARTLGAVFSQNYDYYGQGLRLPASFGWQGSAQGGWVGTHNDQTNIIHLTGWVIYTYSC